MSLKLMISTSNVITTYVNDSAASRQRRPEFDAMETLRRIGRGGRPVERQHGRIGDEDVAPLREVGRSLNRVIRPALADDAEAELPARD